jgi:hypothetical protein
MCDVSRERSENPKQGAVDDEKDDGGIDNNIQPQEQHHNIMKTVQQ